jgi:hypothetical protein
LDTGCGIKRRQKDEGRRQKVVSFQFSVFSLPELREDAYLRPTFIV